MKQLLTVALLFATTCAFSQGKTLYQVYFVKPKPDQYSAWEAAWKTHVTKFHTSQDKINVYEVITGANAGTYHIVHGPTSYADMDEDRTDRLAHEADFEKTMSGKEQMSMGPLIMTFRDSLSFNSNIQADKFVTTVTHVKAGKMSDYLQEMRRSTNAQIQRKAPFGVAAYVQNFAGSDPVVVTMRTLKDGFKELEADYFNRPQNEMRDAYVKEYGQAMWDRRTTTFLTDHTNVVETYLLKHRKDLSSK
jgi:hypothetical protein